MKELLPLGLLILPPLLVLWVHGKISLRFVITPFERLLNALLIRHYRQRRASRSNESQTSLPPTLDP